MKKKSPDNSSEGQYINKRLKEKSEQYEALNEEYLQMNKELKESLEELRILNDSLRQRENTIHHILSSVDEMIWSKSVESDLPDYISNSSSRVLGIDAEILKNNFDLWPDIIHPNDKEYVIKQFENYEPLRYFELEYRIIMKNGLEKWILDKRKITYNDQNQPLRIDGLVADITAKKRTEEKVFISEKTYKGILDSINDAVYIQDKYGFFLDMNKAAEKIEGLSKNELIGKNITDLEDIKNNHVEEIKTAVKKAFNGNSQRIEYHINNKNGKYIQEVMLSPCYYFGDKAVIAVGRDISIHKKNEDKIKEQATRLNAILRTLPDMLFISDKDGYYKEVFTQQSNNLDEGLQKIKGINVKDVFGEKEGERHIKAFLKCVEESKIQILDYQVKEGDYTQFFEARISPLNEEDVLVIVRDITDKKQSDQLLSQERELLESLMNNIPDTIYFKDRKSKFTRINQSQARILGVEKIENAIGKSDFDFFNREHARKAHQEEKQLLKTGKPILGRLEHIKTSQGWRWLNATKVPIKNKKGEITALVGISRDVTQLIKTQEKLVQSEEKYRNITENVFDGIFIKNPEHFEFVNNRFCKMTGYSKKELLSKSFDYNAMVYIDEENRGKVTGKFHGDRDNHSIYEGKLITKTGQKIEVEFSTTNIAIDGGIKILGIIRDISVRKNNEDLKNQVFLTRQSADFKQKFLANMSHEIRTPLTGILGMIDILAKTPLNEEQKEYINTLKMSGINLREIINLILDFSKIEAGKIVLKEEVFKISNVLQGAEKLFKNICRKEIQWHSYIDPQLPQYIETDQHRIFQIVNNFVSNAVKFTKNGSITLRAILDKQMSKPTEFIEESHESERIRIKMEVIDTGIGIREEKIPFLFTPFSQIGQEETKYFEGTGLGLSISKELSKMLGGDIGVESSACNGSNFWFTFIAKVSHKEDAIVKNKATHKQHKSLRILFAEDQRVNRTVITLMLRELGHHCTTVKNGKEIMIKYQPGKYDLILMDIKMPVMDGITATNMLKEKYNNLPPVIGLSANAFEGDREKYMKKGMDEYLTKPLEVKDFQSVINKLGLL